MQSNAGARISRKAFLQSAFILVVLIIASGILTQVVPSGAFQRTTLDGREAIIPGSFVFTPKAEYPIWRWFSAPLEVLGSADGLTVIVIILFLLMVGAAFAVLDACGILRKGISLIVERVGERKYLLLWAVSLFFMLIGAFFGIFEEVIPLVPIIVALSLSMGWDSLVGLGMSILAVNMGFSTAVSNPFTIGVAQKLAGLPLFSGAGLRLVFFVLVYGVFMLFLTGYAKKVERDPKSSPVYSEEQVNASRVLAAGEAGEIKGLRFKPAVVWFGVFMVLIAVVLLAAPFVPAIADYSLPIVALLFLAAGLGAGFLSGAKAGTVLKAAWQGMLGIAPGIPLILMASSIKYIIAQGGVLDTILYQASSILAGVSPMTAALAVYGMALLIEFFIGSGSAKAFLLMPLLIPLAGLVGLTNQTAVTAYCFGDGFSNLVYPTNPVLHIALGLTVVSYGKWLRWSLKLWALILPLTVVFLAIAVAINFGPF